MRWFTIFLTLTACGDSPGDSGIGAIDFCERPSIQDGSLGGGFLLNHCTGCHSSENDENQAKLLTPCVFLAIQVREIVIPKS